jgi:signal transduction histidine kinase
LTVDSASRRPRLALVLLPLGLILGLVAEQFGSGGLDASLVVADLAVGLVFISCGAAVSYRRPADRIGLLMTGTGFAWFLGGIIPAALFLHRGPLAHVMLAFPTGRLPGRFARLAVIGAYVDGTIEAIARFELATITLAIAVVAAACWDVLRASGQVRRGRATGLTAAFGLSIVIVLGSAGRIAGLGVDRSVLVAYELVLAAIAVGLTWDLLRGGWSEAAVTGLVIELGERTETGTLRDRIANALGDPSLTIGYRVGEAGRFVDETGRPVLLPPRGSGRSMTPVGPEGEEIAFLVHDESILGDRRLVESVAAVARIALTNVRLQAEIRDGVAELTASRRRIVKAADAQRRALEEDLQSGAGRRLLALEALLGRAESQAIGDVADDIGAINSDLRGAEAELRDLAGGVYPSFLIEGGLANAVRELAHRIDVPASVDLPEERFPPLVEATGYFVCSEALANVAKHAEASSVVIQATRSNDRLRFVIADDGVGGADLSLGSGLRGLVDRVEALGGKVSVHSPAGNGTRLIADLPLA